MQNPDSLNSYFASIADRTVNASAKTVHDLVNWSTRFQSAEQTGITYVLSPSSETQGWSIGREKIQDRHKSQEQFQLSLGTWSCRASSEHRRGFLLVIGRKLARLCFAPYQRPRNFIGVMEPRSRFPCDVQEFRISTALILACFRMYEDQNQNNSWLSRLLFKEKTCSQSYLQDSTKAWHFKLDVMLMFILLDL